jgi:hypothetical protein
MALSWGLAVEGLEEKKKKNARFKPITMVPVPVNGPEMGLKIHLSPPPGPRRQWDPLLDFAPARDMVMRVEPPRSVYIHPMSVSTGAPQT